jgi:hypothetical protein
MTVVNSDFFLSRDGQGSRSKWDAAPGACGWLGLLGSTESV